MHQQQHSQQTTKLQELWWFKSAQAVSVEQLATLSGLHRTTISRWLGRYRSRGLSSLVETRPRSGRPVAIAPEIRQQIERELEDPQGFETYKEVQHWLRSVWGVNAAYKTVHKTVRYRLKAKLKRPRPASQQQAPGAVEDFQKLCRS